MIFLLSMLISHCRALLYQKSRRYSRGVSRIISIMVRLKTGIIGTTRNHCEYILSMYINMFFLIIIIMNRYTYIYTHIYIYVYIYRAKAGGSPEANCILFVWIWKMLISHCVLKCFMLFSKSVRSAKVSMSARINLTFVHAEK